jgi:hypothetical protein
LPSRTRIWLAPNEVEVHHAQAEGLEEAQAGAVEERRHQAVVALELPQDGAHFVARHHDRQAAGGLGAHDVLHPADVATQHVAVQEEKRAERPRLGRGADPSADCQGR